jgi:hypothetical protein
MNDRATAVAKRLRGLCTAATLLSVVLYGVCLAAPALRVMSDSPTGHDDHPGWFALYVGWMWVVSGVPAWLANPLLWGAWLSNGSKPRVGLTLALMSLVVALSFSILDEVFPNGSVDRLFGYYIWIASILLAACAAAFADVSGTNGSSSFLHHPSD